MKTFAPHNVSDSRSGLRAGLIDAARLIAKEQGQAVWELVQDALTTHVARHPALLKTSYASLFKQEAQGPVTGTRKHHTVTGFHK